MDRYICQDHGAGITTTRLLQIFYVEIKSFQLMFPKKKKEKKKKNITNTSENLTFLTTGKHHIK
jgi:hypothetical protein